MIKKQLFVSGLFAIALMTSCGGGNQNQENLSEEEKISGEVQVDGSSTVYPITEAVAEEFQTVYPNILVKVGLSGTGGGFKKFVRGETDINNASREISAHEDSLAKLNNISYIELEIAYDGLAVVVNPENTWCSEITVEELKKIWEPEAQGKIKKWNQIRPEWPDAEIHLYGAGVESGTYDYFTEVIVGKSHSSRGDYTSSEDDNVLIQGISTDKYALGFFGLAYYEENKDKIKLVAVDDLNDSNGKGPILPTLETVRNKTYAPLSRPLFIYVNSKAAQRPAVQKFVEFYLDNCRELSQEIGYVPLTEEDINVQKEKWNNFLKTLSSSQVQQ